MRAVDGVDLDWRTGETLGLVGESGCGKSTLARSLVGLETPSDGSIEFDGQPVDRDLRALRRRVQLIFQDPYQSMNPRRTVGAQVQEGLAASGMRSGDARVQKAVAALHDAGLAPADRFWRRYPHELSGGQRQRVVIAAALALEPEALICDEPVSALDVSVRTQVLRLLADLRVSRQLSLLLITHDVGLAWSMCDRVAVMYLGRIVELGTTEQVLGDPQHPYTKALLAVAPRIEPRTGARVLLQGEPPDATRDPDRLPLPSSLPGRLRPLSGRRPVPSRTLSAAPPAGSCRARGKRPLPSRPRSSPGSQAQPAGCRIRIAVSSASSGENERTAVSISAASASAPAAPDATSARSRCSPKRRPCVRASVTPSV